MKKILIFGILAIFVSASMIGVLASEKNFSSDQFTEMDGEMLVNVSSPTLIIGEDGYNDDEYIFVYNNATYSGLEFNISAGPSNGHYPSDVRLDLGNNGRNEYMFEGYGYGEMGNQSWIVEGLDDIYKEIYYLPSKEGTVFHVMLPSDADVKGFELNLTHPVEAVSEDALIDKNSKNGNNVDNWAQSYYYRNNYDYEYWSGTYTYSYSYDYGYAYYYPKEYYASSSSYKYSRTPSYSGSVSYDYGSYGYDYTYYDTGTKDSRVHIDWDLEHRDFMLPEDASITKYELYYPIGEYGGYNYYGYDWTSKTDSYYHGNRTYSCYAITDDWPTTTSYSYTYINPYNQAAINSAYYDKIPETRSTPEDEYFMAERWMGNSYIYYNYGVSYDLTDLVAEWQNGDLDPNGVMIMLTSTDFDSAPPWEGYSYQDYSDKKSKDYYSFHGDGYMYTPFYSGYKQYQPWIHYEYTLSSRDPWLDIADNGNKEWTYSGIFEGSDRMTTTTDITTSINTYLDTHFPDWVDEYDNAWTYVPIRIGAEAAGKIILNELSIIYDYTAQVHYNPSSGTVLSELQSLVPNAEDGWSLLKINVTSSTEGSIVLSDLIVEGSKPNYRPELDTSSFMDYLSGVELYEGMVDPYLIPLSDFISDDSEDSSDLDYLVQMNSEPTRVDFSINIMEGTRGAGDKVYLGIDTTKSDNWFGDVVCQASATDSDGKDVWFPEFTLTLESVNDYPYLDSELPELVSTEGFDNIIVDYEAPIGRDAADGKISILVGRHGEPYFSDIEMDETYVDFELLGNDMEPMMLVQEDDAGFRIYRGVASGCTLYVLPPEYTDDPDNYVILFGSQPDMNTMDYKYYLRMYVSDDPLDLKGQNFYDMPIVIQPENDAPKLISIPEVMMTEDEEYTSNVAFIETYVTDVDSDISDVTVTFMPVDPEVHVRLNDEGKINIRLDQDFSKISDVKVIVSDGIDEVETEFRVLIRSVNDPPTIVVHNLYNDIIVNDLFYIRGNADDVEKSIRSIEVAVVPSGMTVTGEDWAEADGSYIWQHLLDIREFEQGNYDVHIRSYDGRDYSDVQFFTVQIVPQKADVDPSRPVVMITTSLSGQYADTFEIEGTVTDESGYIEFVEYRLDGGIWYHASLEDNDWTVFINTRTLTNAEHNFSVRAYDLKSYSVIEYVIFEVFNEDSDLDGISNIDEKSLLMDPFNSIDGAMDFDNDGFSNAQEIQENYDPFDPNNHPDDGTKDPLIDGSLLLFIIVAVLATIIILGLFLMNINMDRNSHMWRDDLNRMRSKKMSKTLLQRIVEIAPTFGGYSPAPSGPALPGTAVEQAGDAPAALPPMEGEGGEVPPQ